MPIFLVHANPELQFTAAQALLHADRTAQRLNSARKLCQQAIARGLENAATVLHG